MTRFFSGIVVLIGLTFSGCGVDSAFDCHGVCSRYKTCFDASYDVMACEERCRDNAMDDSTYRAKADRCDACIDTKACATSVFSCGADCTAVVP